METTALYVELVIIGLQSSIWMISLVTFFTDEQFLLTIFDMFDSVPSSIFFVGILYIIGIIFDRLADIVFLKYEARQKREAKIISKNCGIIWEKSGREHFLQFVRAKIRILRASSLNMPIILLSICMNICKSDNINYWLLGLWIVVCSMLIAFSIVGCTLAIKKYYKGMKIAEDELGISSDVKRQIVHVKSKKKQKRYAAQKRTYYSRR